jgi:hypothetical protein
MLSGFLSLHEAAAEPVDSRLQGLSRKPSGTQKDGGGKLDGVRG